MALASLAACSTAAAPEDNGVPQSDVSLTIARYAGPQADAEKALVEQYTAETGVQVTVEAIDFAGLKQKETLNMSTKTGAYDLVYMNDVWLGEYASAGYLTSLNDFVKDESLTGPDWNFEDFSQTGIDTYSVDGELLALPNFLQTPVLAYNKNALAAAGFKVPKTWDELIEVAKYFKEHGSGIALPYRQGTAIYYLLDTLSVGNGSADGFFDADGKLDVTNPKVIETAAYLQELGKYSLEGSNGWHWDEVNKALQFNQTPIGISITGLVGILEDPAQATVAGQMAYAPLPHSKSVTAYFSTFAWGVPVDSKNKEEAFKLAAWLTSQEQLTAMSQTNPGFVGFRTSLYEDEQLKADAPWLESVQAGLKNAVFAPRGAAASELQQAISAELNGLVSNGGDPKTAVEKVQAAMAAKF